MYNYVKSYADRFKLFDEIKFKHEVIILEGIFHEYKKMLIFKKIKKKAFYLQDYIIIKHKKLYLNKNNRIKLIFK